MRIHKIFPDEFPEPWASDWGEDDYGIFMGFTYKGVRQLFRWIEPGTFLMGSAEDEPQRGNDETQHKVTLTKGFWLADTTVTQALWEAVVGENPSQFKGENHPVENISWNDAQAFISKINGMRAELRLCLPTEAQWEYACRAGSRTAFSFGQNITTTLANYNVESEYDKANVSAGTTCDGKKFQPNVWGLYSMHGNIWEWCQDYYGEYQKQSVTDPIGTQFGNSRVLRGGSWLHRAKDCRSAYRSYYFQTFRNAADGFRLARCL